jgi:preprotein translocase subunit SecA
MGRFGIPEDEPIESGMITRSLETAQARIEGFNFDARKQVLAYDDVMNTQRLVVYARRRAVLLGAKTELERLITDMLSTEGTEALLAEKEVGLGYAYELTLRRILLQTIDTFWLEHLETMDYLRRAVGLRAYGQRDPLIEYRREGLARFRHLEESIKLQVAEALPKLARIDAGTVAREAREEEKVRAGFVAAGKEEQSSSGQIRNASAHGRNDLVTIRKGNEVQTLKFKKAEPLLAQGWVIGGQS